MKTEVRIEGNQCIAYVYIDYDSMDSYENATGFQVAEWANEGSLPFYPLPIHQ